MLSKHFIFKSKSPFFEKERDGVKPNTVRKIDLSDERFIDLIVWNRNGFKFGDITIEIFNEEGNDSFTRDIEDISIWNDLMIISWRP